MKHGLYLCLAVLLLAAPQGASAKVNIFACEPEWAALADEIGGKEVKTFAATHALQDPHHIRARPSLISKAGRADLVICSGAGLEVGWLPLLLQKAGSNVQRGSVGYLMAADIVPVLEKPSVVDRSMGDVHPQGNPHVHLNPYHVARVAEEVTTRLTAIDATNAAFYQARSADFLSRWHTAITRWEEQASVLKGARIVVHHRSFSYLLDWLKMYQVAAVEPKPGLPPTTSHLEGLLQDITAQPADIIIRSPYDPDTGSLWLSEKTGIPAIILPYTIGGDKESNHLFALFNRTIALLLKASK